VGPAGAGVKVDRTGIHVDSGTQKAKDVKLGVHLHLGVGVGLNVNFSQVSRAYQNSEKSLDALGQYLTNEINNDLPGFTRLP
jgi:hypothetical protein